MCPKVQDLSPEMVKVAEEYKLSVPSPKNLFSTGLCFTLRKSLRNAGAFKNLISGKKIKAEAIRERLPEVHG